MSKHLLFLTLAAVVLAGNAPSLKRQMRTARWMATNWNGRSYQGNGDYADAVRELIGQHAAPSDNIYLITRDPGGRLLSIERSIQITAAWAHSPGRVRYGGVADIKGGDDLLITSCESGGEAIRSQIPSHYAQVAASGSAALWRRMFFAPEGGEDENSGGIPAVSDGFPPCGRVSPQAAASAVRELSGVGLVAAFAGFCLWAGGWAGMLGGLLLFSVGMAAPPLAGFTPPRWYVLALAGGVLGGQWLTAGTSKGVRAFLSASRLRTRMPALPLLLALAFFALLAALTLTHTFTAPCGLGVFGGKARLLFLSGGVPEGFFTAGGWDTLQPAYPPGWALLTLGCYGAAGACGEYWTQLLGCAAAAAGLAFLCGRSGGVPAMLWVAAAFCSAPAVLMGTHYYAEPLMALFVLAGWERVRGRGDDATGWALIGAAGWIKNEGILFLPALWLATRVLWGARAASLPKLLAGLALPAAWHLGYRIAGGGIPDYAPAWGGSLRQAGEAAAYLFRQGFLKPWQYGLAFPLAALALLVPEVRRARALPAACLAVLAIFCALTGIFAMSQAMDFGWHLSSSAERLLWIPSLLLIRELLPARPPLTGPPSPCAG